MAGRPPKMPSYCHHKASGQAVVRISGRDHYLGVYGTTESHEQYRRTIAEHCGNGQTTNVSELVAGSRRADLTVVELIAAYWEFTKTYYIKNGKATSEQKSIRLALRPLKSLYGILPVGEFGPLALEVVREEMIEGGITRTRINQHIGRIRRMFKWGVSKELIPVTVHQALLCVEGLRSIFMAARLDGRSFTRLTKEVSRFETPFDVRFRNLMVATTESLMTCGFQVLYGYTESDEISLLFASEEQLFGRKLRKYNSTLAGEASAQFSVRFGQTASFDCRISQLPTPELVIDYFRWRNEDAARNALNAWCYWTLRKDGLNEQQATKRLLGQSVSQKNELLFQYSINFNDIPSWQKRGVGLYWEQYDKPAVNPITMEEVVARRRRIQTEFDLPMKNEYGEFVRSLLFEPQTAGAK